MRGGQDWLTRVVVNSIITILLVGLLGVLCSLIVPAIVLFVAQLPFAFVSVLVEAWWRIRSSKPYVVPNVVMHDQPSPASTPNHSTNNWLVALAIKLWLGRSWGFRRLKQAPFKWYQPHRFYNYRTQ